MVRRISTALKSHAVKKHRYDILAIVALATASLYLTRPLLDWSQTTFGDITMSAGWLSWLKQSLFDFHQFPTWSPLWNGGMPFFGMVPPGGFYLMIPFYLLTGSTATAYNLAIVIMSLMAGISMYLYLRHLSPRALPAFLGAGIYLVLPVHSASMLFWGHFEILCAYAVVPLVLLFTDLFLHRSAGLYLFLMAICLGFVLLSQIEFAFIFLLLYVPYVGFSLFAQSIGWRRLSLLVTANRMWVVLTVLVLSIPLYFYVSVLTQYGHFAGLQPHDIEGGLSYYTLHNFGDAFLGKAGSISDSWLRPSTDCYTGPVTLVILLMAMALLLIDKDKKRVAGLLFFLLMGMAFLILSMGIYGPLFPILRELVPALQGMRVTLRFHYFFALCLPVIFTLSCLSLNEARTKTPWVPARVGHFIRSLVPILLVLGLVVDFSQYFDLYHIRLVNRQEFDRQLGFIQQNTDHDYSLNAGITRIEFYPPYSTPAEYWTKPTLELAGTALPWDQYREVVTYYHITSLGLAQDQDHLEFFSYLLSIDYVMLQNYEIAPSDSATLPEYSRKKLASLDALSGTTDEPLIYEGRLETDYYTMYLYQVKATSDKVRFHALDSSIVLLSDELFVSYDMFRSYTEMTDITTAASFLDRVVAVSSDIEDAAGTTIKVASLEDIPSLLSGESETNDSAAQVDGLNFNAKGLSLDVNAGDDGLVSLAYYYNPWWKAYVDGRESPVLRVNGIFAGTYVAEGLHHVEFIYDYPSLPNVISRLWS